MKFLDNLVEAKTEEIMRDFAPFTDGVRVQMLIDRSVSNSNKGSKRWINKLISNNPEEFKSNIIKLLELQYYLANPDIRLYSCVNKRNLDKAIKYFNHKQLDIATEEEKIKFYTRLNERFCSCLMKPENRAESLFLIDYDGPYDGPSVPSLLYDNLKIICKIEVLDPPNSGFLYGTPNGCHFITKPFDPRLLTAPNCEIKKDALLLLHAMAT